MKFTILAVCVLLYASTVASETVGNYIGNYKFSYLTTQADVSVVEENSKLIMHWRFSDGSTWELELIEIQEEGETRLVKKPRKFGEYYLKDNKGNLESYDNEGYITTMQLTE